jgi:3-dehydroquinate dehydratase I
MKINYCLPIIKETKKEILEVINAYRKEYEYFEVWLDYVKDLDQSFLKELLEKHQDKLIIVLRQKNLEPIKMSLEKRLEIIKLLNNSDSYLDLDISQQEELKYIETNAFTVKKIISYHNYEETPEKEKLNEIIDRIKKYTPEIIKISTYCKSEKDALNLLYLQQKLKKEEKKHIILGMGKSGIVTRIFGTVWGNEITFAPIDKSDASAPGQLTKNQLENIYEILNS